MASIFAVWRYFLIVSCTVFTGIGSEPRNSHRTIAMAWHGQHFISRHEVIGVFCNVWMASIPTAFVLLHENFITATSMCSSSCINSPCTSPILAHRILLLIIQMRSIILIEICNTMFDMFLIFLSTCIVYWIQAAIVNIMVSLAC